MELPQSVRDNMVEELDDYLEAIATPEAEAITSFVVELLETAADELGLDDIIGTLEDEGALDDSLVTLLEEEMESNDEFEYTGEEIASLLEKMCDIEWSDEAFGEEEEDEFDEDE